MTDANNLDDIGTRLVAASRIHGTSVYNTAGDKLGVVHDVMLDKQSGKIEYAVMSFGGFLGIGSRHYPLPWHTMTYSDKQHGYVVDVDRALLGGAPSYDPEDISAWEDPTYGRQLHDYYGRPRV
jgi:sporulation protein YlmC with PRC-barrel domain